MSSEYVRDEIETFVTTNLPAENYIDITAKSDEFEFMVQDAGLDETDHLLLIQFIGANEEPITLAAGNAEGRYRETGSLFFHVTEPLDQVDVYQAILTRTETLRNLFRGQRINDILINSVSPPNFESSATLQFSGGYQSASIVINYQRDLNL